jgi:3-oxoacyl-[acyl-carrier protein] reductase
VPEPTGPESAFTSDDVILITGAAGPDIGRATAQAFLAQGAKVAVTDRSARRVEEVTDALSDGKQGRVAGFVLDLRYPETFEERLKDITETLGKPTVLVNNAAVTKIVSLDEMNSAEWDDILTVNLRSSWQLAVLVGREMKKARAGSIINVSSVGAYYPGWLEGAYCVSKAGLNALTREIASEFGPFGIRCNTVAPAFVDSKFIRDHWSRYEEYLKKTPLRRFVTAKEVANVIVFLASPLASGVSGEVISVSAGWHMPA